MTGDFNIFPLGDSAITIDLGNLIQEELNDKVLAMQRWLTNHRFEGFTDSIVAYSSLSVFYDPVEVCRKNPSAPGAFQFVSERLREAWWQSPGEPARDEEPVRIPVCYEGDLAPDLIPLAAKKDISPEEIIRLHISGIYRVYMIGFLPGFAYLGETSELLAVTRKPRPTPVKAGSVGITGRQTGIYPLDSPGGWHIIGRTPVGLFDPTAEIPVRLKIGDRVEFYPITRKEFGRITLL
jgi:inhibitor of KinA